MVNEYIQEILKNNNFKMTRQRLALLEVLNSNSESLLSAEEIYAYTKAIYPNTNLSTIYRNLEKLEILNLLFKTKKNDDQSYYKLICNVGHHHHHIICNKCGNVVVFEYCPSETFSQIAKERGFTLLDHKLELYGICPACK